MYKNHPLKKMKTTKKLTTSAAATKGFHIQGMRKRFASNRATILKELNMSDLAYELQFLEAGCQFLEQFYDREKEVENRAYKRLSSDATHCFWKWFKAEFKVLENDFVNVLIGGELHLEPWMWDELVDSIPHDSMIEQSFFQFIKLFAK